jgi:hypothetical protein
VTVAYWLLVVAAVLGLLGAALVGVLIPESVDANRAASALAQRRGLQVGSPGLDSAVVALAITVSTVSIVLSVAFAVAMLVLAPRMRRGGSRARIALIVLAAVQVVGIGGAYGIGLVHFLACAAVVVLLILPTTAAWFRAVNARPSG